MFIEESMIKVKTSNTGVISSYSLLSKDSDYQRFPLLSLLKF